MTKKQSGFYLSARAVETLERLAREQDRAKSEIVSDALIYYGNFPDEMDASMRRCMEERNKDILDKMGQRFFGPKALRRKIPKE